MHEQRARAGSFGSDPERYDRARPSYPAGLVDDLLAGASPRRVLDVGCGTAIAGRLFAARGCDVLGVEPDARMAAVARAHGLAVEVAGFEDWDARGRTFDLAISGQAWHWIDPDRGARRLAEVVRPGGVAGLFWNLSAPAGEASAALEAVYARLEPGLARETVAVWWRDVRHEAALDALRATGAFAPVVVRSWRWEQRLDTPAWLDRMQTFSDHRLLPDERRERLVRTIAGELDALGGRLTVAVETWLVRAERLTQAGARSPTA